LSGEKSVIDFKITLLKDLSDKLFEDYGILKEEIKEYVEELKKDR